MRSRTTERHAPRIMARYGAIPDITLAELRLVPAEDGISLAVATLWRSFRRRRITRKKTGHAAEQDRPDMLKRRRAWFRAQVDLNPRRLARRFARGQKRDHAHRDRGQGRTPALPAALTAPTSTRSRCARRVGGVRCLAASDGDAPRGTCNPVSPRKWEGEGGLDQMPPASSDSRLALPPAEVVSMLTVRSTAKRGR